MKHAGQCEHGDCMLDARYRGFGRTHAPSWPCDNCKLEQWEHVIVHDKDGREVQLCPTATWSDPT